MIDGFEKLGLVEWISEPKSSGEQQIANTVISDFEKSLPMALINVIKQYEAPPKLNGDGFLDYMEDMRAYEVTFMIALNYYLQSRHTDTTHKADAKHR